MLDTLAQLADDMQGDLETTRALEAETERRDGMDWSDHVEQYTGQGLTLNFIIMIIIITGLPVIIYFCYKRRRAENEDVVARVLQALRDEPLNNNR